MTPRDFKWLPVTKNCCKYRELSAWLLTWSFSIDIISFLTILRENLTKMYLSMYYFLSAGKIKRIRFYLKCCQCRHSSLLFFSYLNDFLEEWFSKAKLVTDGLWIFSLILDFSTSPLWLFKCSKTIRKTSIFFKEHVCIIFTETLFFSVKNFFFQIKLFI